MLKRLHIIVSGRVQGVGFRWVCMKYATLYHLTGNVRNLEDGNVEIHIQGEEKDLLTFIHTMPNDNRRIRVDHLRITEEPLVNKETQFHICGYF